MTDVKTALSKKIFTQLFLLLMVVVFFLSSFTANALTPDQKALYSQNILYYDLACSDIAASDISAGDGSPEGTTFPDLDPAAMAAAINKFIAKENPNSKLIDLGETIVAGAENSNISPFLIVAHAHAESGLADPGDYNVSNGNNSFGRTATPSQPNFSGARLWYKWSSVEASVDHTAEENRGAVGGGDIAAYIREQYPDIIDRGDLDAYLLEYVADGNESWYGQLVRKDVGQMADMAADGGGGAGDTDFDEISDLNLSGIAEKYDLHSVAVREVDKETSASHQANVTPNSVASLIKLVIADAFLSTNPNLNKRITINSSHLYGGSTPQGTPWDPKVGQKFTLKQVLTNTLAKSSNTQANVLISEVGGPGKVNELTNYNSTTVNSYFSYSGSSGAPNQSTAGDLTNAMNKIFSSGGKYKVAQDALRDSTYTFGLGSEANKWGGHSEFTGNVGLFSANNKKYIITVLSEEKWEDAVLPEFPITRGTQPSPSVGKIKNATNDIIKGLEGKNNVEVPGGCACPGSDTELSGENGAIQVYNYLIAQDDLDLTPAQVAGIIGNLMNESGGNSYDLDPTVPGIGMCDPDCMGIVQWSVGRWAALESWANSKGKNPLSLETQAEYIKVELKGTESVAWGKLKAVNGDDEAAARKAAEEFDTWYERSSAGQQERQDNAARFFNEHVKGGGLTGGSPDSDSSCSGGGGGSGESTGRFAWPDGNKKGSLSSCFGYRASTGSNHEGIDIGIPVGLGDDVTASDGGKVTEIGGGYGIVTIEHDNGFSTRYLHNSEILVAIGDKVSQGDVIAKAGGVGPGGPGDYDPHIHFEVLRNGGPEDPLKHLAKEGRTVQSGASNCPSGTF